MNNRRVIGEIGFGTPLKPKGPFLRKAAVDKRGKPLPLGPSLDQDPKSGLRAIPQPSFDAESVLRKPAVKKKLTNPQVSTSGLTTTTQNTTSPVTTSLASTTSTTEIGTTMPKETTPSRSGNRRRGRNWNKDRSDSNYNNNYRVSSNVLDTSSQYNATVQERGIFYPLAESNKIDFSVPLPNPFHFIPDIPDSGPSYDPATSNFYGEFRSSLLINISNFSTRFYNLKSGGDAISSYYKIVKTIFDRVSDDVFRDSRSNTVSIWTFTNFTTYLYTVCRALEWISTIDSILAYEPRDGIINQGLMKLKDQFNSSKILTSRSDLRQALLGKVFPTKFAELIRWFYQSYQTSELKYSPCYRYVNDGLFITKIDTTDDLATTIDTIISEMNTSSNAQIGGALSKLYPNWIIKDIPGGYHDSLYDVHHSEMFINEPVIFVDRLTSTTAPCVYPNPSTESEDIAYYLREMPSGTNGFSQLLSCFHKCDANSFNWTGSNDVKYNSGIRHLVNVAPTTAVNVFKSNRFYFDPVNVRMEPRVYTFFNNMADFSAHKAITTSATVKATAMSSAPRGYGRVYYNNISSNILNMRLFVNHLFGMKS